MNLTLEEKKEAIKKHGKSSNDSGTTEVQVAMFTTKINDLTNHLKANRKDYNTERALVNMVGKRKRLLNYLKEKDIARYRSIVKSLGLRK